VELKTKPREGVQGILYVFEKLSEACETSPGIILSFFAYLTDLKRSIKPFSVKVEEKRLLFPDLSDIATIEIQSIDQMIEKFALEAIFKKEITKTTSTRDITNLLCTIFYGGIVTAHINQLTPIKYFFKKNVEMTLKGLQ
jgi:hypothetical protein